MKKKFIKLGIVAALCSTMTLSSCIGSFKLTNDLLSWNKNIGSKFVNELVFFAFWILPVYEVAGLADILVLNSIEFWSGTNPVAQGTYKIRGNDGIEYLVKCDKKGYTIINTVDKSKLRFDFNVEKQQWSTNIDGVDYVFLEFIDDTHVKIPSGNGSYMVFDTTAERNLAALN